MNLYSYLFYLFYKSSLKSEGKWNKQLQTPIFTANILMSIFAMVFVFAIVIVFDVNIKGYYSGWLPGISGLYLFLFNYAYLIWSGKYLTDFAKYEKISSKKLFIHKTIFIMVFISVICLTFYMIERNRGKIFLQNTTKFNLVKYGMTRDEIKILSKPNSIRFTQFKNKSEILSYEIDLDVLKGVDIYINDSSKKVTFIRFCK